MEYFMHLKDRSFAAIKAKHKKIEIRVKTDRPQSVDYQKLEIGDTIIFENSTTKEKMKCEIEEINWYKTAEEMLIQEGTRYTLSSTNDFEEGIKSLYNIPDYREGIEKNGVFAIHIKVI